MSNLDSSTWYATRAFEMAMEESNDTIAVMAQYQLGINLQLEGRLQEATDMFRQVISLTQPGQLIDMHIEAHGRIGNAFTDLAMLDSAMVYLLKFDALVDEYWGKEVITAKLALGEVYRAMGRMDQSDSYKIEAIQRSERSGKKMDRIISLYYYLEDHKTSLGDPEFQEYLMDYIELMEPNIEGSMGSSHVELLLKDLPIGQQRMLLQKAITDNINSGKNASILVYYEMLIHSYLKEGANTKALRLAEDALAYARSMGDRRFESDFNLLMYQSHEGLKNYPEAISYLRRHYTMMDSLRNERLNENLDELKIQYETAEREKTIAGQQLELERQRQQRNYLLGGLAMLLWFGGFGLAYLWYRNATTKKLALQEAQIQHQKIQQLEQEKDILAMTSMIEGQEAERKRIAQDLHDGLGSLLSNIKSQLHALERKVDEMAGYDLYGKATSMIDSASQEVRRIATNMMPMALAKLGLKAAIKDLASKVEQDKNIRVNLQLSGLDNRMEESTEIMLFRIIQELVNNVVKHAGASTLLIQLNQMDSDILLTVEDNGKGFDYDSALATEGIGIKSVRSRVNHLKGNLDVTSSKDGTCIVVHVPKTK